LLLLFETHFDGTNGQFWIIDGAHVIRLHAIEVWRFSKMWDPAAKTAKNPEVL